MAAPQVVFDADVLGRARTGDETYVENLLRELGGARDVVRVAAITRDRSRLPAGIDPIELPARSQALRMFVRMPLLLRRLRPALTHLHYVIPPGVGGTVVLTVHDISYERSAAFVPAHDLIALRALVPRSIRRAARVLTVSEWTKQELLDRYRVEPSAVVVTPNGVDPIYAPEGPAEGGRPYLLFVGALQPRKDPVAAVETLARLDGQHRLLMAGPDRGGAADVRRAAEQHGLVDRVELRGYVSREELARLYRGAACLIFPSRYEGFGLPILEAMASGTPVVAVRATSVPEVAGDAAVLVEPGSAEALADGFARALADRARLRAAGVERAAGFTWAETARRTLVVYRELL
jgi:glycosyltransferase involved in cell wall biosynthesis